MDKMTELIRLLEKWNLETLNCCVIVHMDKETKRVKSISPLLQATTVKEIYTQLSETRDAIQGFLNDLISKNLVDNGQGN